MYDDISKPEKIITIEDKINNDLYEWSKELTLDEKEVHNEDYEMFIDDILPILTRHIRTGIELTTYCKLMDYEFGHYWNIKIQETNKAGDSLSDS